MTKDAGDVRLSTGAGSPASREVSWWAAHEFLEAALAQANCGPLPTAGTPAWAALADGDPRKLLALAAAGEHHVLRQQIGQEQRALAAEDVWGGADWSEVARQVQRRREIDEMRRGAA
ncbi:MAG: DUF2742 domain-containing protein [Mycolicibacterium rufum]|nr:DUF2742 domain-containing protein [Mycolicibacterium rufum]